jgi:hypothetical protein
MHEDSVQVRVPMQPPFVVFVALLATDFQG